MPDSSDDDPLWFLEDQDAFRQRFILSLVIQPPPSRRRRRQPPPSPRKPVPKKKP